jgi:glycosyltransferase involved in cell wall biosynthesis
LPAEEISLRMEHRTVWIINPYGTLPGEQWAAYRSTMLAESLSKNGFSVTQFISNFEHRSKSFRSTTFATRVINDYYKVSIVPSRPYRSHISLGRVLYEREYAKNLLQATKELAPPDYIILAEPSLFYYNILMPLFARKQTRLVIDVIDIYPELFELVIPKFARPVSSLLLAPFFFWRKRLYRRADAIVAVAEDYRDIAKTQVEGTNISVEVVYWAYDAPSTTSSRVVNEKVKTLVANKQPDEIWIIYAGTLGENYDIPSIVSVQRELSKELRDKARIKFIVAGDGPLKQLCASNSSEDFIFLGRVDPVELQYLYPHCDIALSTYRGESTVAMPIKAFDYIAHGLPVVNSLKRDLGDLVTRKKIGINYNASEKASLFGALMQLITDKGLREQLSVNTRNLADEFRSDKQYLKFVHLLRSL